MIERRVVGSAEFWTFDDPVVWEKPTASIEVARSQEISQYVPM
jgi:hypothetical protein